MSLILGYATKTNAVIMSDGKAGGTIRPSESCNKTRKINDNIILGFAGYLEDITYAFDYITDVSGNDLNNYMIDDFWNIIISFMRNKQTPKFFHSSFIIIGRHNNGNMYTSIIGDNTNYMLEEHKVENPRYLTIGGSIDGEIINQIYSSNIKQFGSPIEKRIIDTIRKVSALDNSINTNTFTVTI